MKKIDIMAKKNDVVQIIKGDWIGCLIQVTKVKNWGIEGFVLIPGKGKAFIRINHEDYVVIGQVYLITE